MDAKAFFYLVSQMRTMQKEYFKTRSKSSLEQSKDLEKRVDAEIQRVNKIIEERANPQLFWHENNKWKDIRQRHRHDVLATG